MSHGNFPQTLLHVEGRDIVGGPKGQRAKNDWSKKKLVTHQHSPVPSDFVAVNSITHRELQSKLIFGVNCCRKGAALTVLECD
jgi:hypothetical protein